jgi:16S rRNA (cytosine1402-N4)-methyltransferase
MSKHPYRQDREELKALLQQFENLKAGLAGAVSVVKPGGRIAVISYHSLEDRIVKHFIARSSKEGSLKVITKKPLTPGAEEIRSNPSSRSAKLRAAERI